MLPINLNFYVDYLLDETINGNITQPGMDPITHVVHQCTNTHVAPVGDYMTLF